MKKILLLMISVLLLISCNQEPSNKHLKEKNLKSSEIKTLEKELNKYTEATLNNDIDSLMGFVYSKVFTLISKEKMKKELTNAYKKGLIPQISDVKHLDLGSIQKYDKGLFSIITSSMTTKIKSPTPNKPKFESYLLQKLKKDIQNRGTVSFNSEKHIYIIKSKSKTIAIQEKDGWKFIRLKQAERHADKGILPKAIMDYIKSLEENLTIEE